MKPSPRQPQFSPEKTAQLKQKHMKKLLTLTSVLCAVAALAFVTGCASTATTTTTAAAPSKNAGRLIIERAANFGDRLSLNVSIDGAQVAGLVMGRSYNGTLSAGQHVLMLSVDPNLNGTPPTTKRLTVQAGQTYSFTAMWSGQRLVLR
jgi:hypothetical protein